MDKRPMRQELAQRYKDMIGKTYRHFKGGLYEVIDIAVHSENAGVLVIYKTKKDPTLVWARPLDMFLSDVDKDKMNDYSEQFDKERKYRVEVSYHKYGSARKNFGEGRVDAIATAERCLDAFKKDHNTEHLVDAANYLMFRFMYPMPGGFFKPTDSSGSVGTVGTPINMERE